VQAGGTKRTSALRSSHRWRSVIGRHERLFRRQRAVAASLAAKSSRKRNRSVSMAADRAWENELNKLEKTLLTCLECRAKPLMPEALVCRAAFKSFDTDSDGYIDYREFVRGMEKFGLNASPAVRGLFDRYAGTDGESETLSYDEFVKGILGYLDDGQEKPPVPPRKDVHSWELNGDAQRRNSPANKWQNSSPDGFPNQRPIRQISLANDKWRSTPHWKWSKDDDGNWQADKPSRGSP